MGFEIINKLKKERGLTNAQIAKMSGVTLSTLDKITSGANTNPKLDTLQSICRVLGCRLDDFDDHPIVKKQESPSPEESEIIKKYRFLDPDGQETVRTVLDREVGRKQAIQARDEEIEKLKRRAEIAESKAETAQDTEMYSYPYLRKIACAGSGFIFDDIPTDTINVPYMHGADFIIGVNGDSMEPTFSDGELLYVRKTNQLQYGDIGIFIYAGECFVKEYGRCGLISHNPEYDNISGTEDIRLVGKVVGKVPE